MQYTGMVIQNDKKRTIFIEKRGYYHLKQSIGWILIVNPLLRNCLLILCFTLLPVLCNSQVTFEKNYQSKVIFTSYNVSQAPYILNTRDSGYYLFTWNGEDTNLLLGHWLGVTRLNKMGAVLWNKYSDNYSTLFDFGYGGLGGVVQYPDSSFVMLWNDSYSNQSVQRTGLIHFDKNGNSIWGKKYIYPSPWGYPYMNNIALTLDKGIIGWGMVVDDINSSNWMVLMKTDSSGNVQWCKSYLPDSSYDGGFESSSVTPTADSGFLVDFVKNDTDFISSGGCLMKTDAHGNLLWMKEYYGMRPRYGKPQVVGSNIYLLWWGIGANYVTVTKTDIQGVPILANSYTSSNAYDFFDGLTLNDGNTILSIQNTDSTSSILKIDSAGTILWANGYGMSDTLILSNLNLTLDGGILGYGVNTRAHATTHLAWQLIKTDAMGRDGCEKPVIFTKIPTNTTWKNTFCYVQNMTLTVKDTILNFHSVSMDTTTLCAVNHITKPVAKINEQKDTLCDGHCTCFTDNSLNNPTTWKWSFVGANPDSSNAENPCNICYASSGKYRVRLIAGNIGGIDTTYDSIIVVQTPSANVCCDTTIHPGQQIQLTVNGGTIYQWIPSYGLSCFNCPDPVANPSQSTVYTVIVSNGGDCTATSMVSIDVSCGQVFVPTVFSPNMAINNILYVRCDCITTMDFIVFDRWGNKVFESQNLNMGWDGTYKGQPMCTDTYVWYLNATLQDGTTIKKKGNVTLIR